MGSVDGLGGGSGFAAYPGADVDLHVLDQYRTSVLIQISPKEPLDGQDHEQGPVAIRCARLGVVVYITMRFDVRCAAGLTGGFDLACGRYDPLAVPF